MARLLALALFYNPSFSISELIVLAITLAIETHLKCCIFEIFFNGMVQDTVQHMFAAVTVTA